MILADTGFWLALASPRDRHHRAAVTALAAVREPLVTTWPVITETCHLLMTRLGTHAEVAFLESASRGAFQVFALDASHLPRLAALMRQYHALPMDLADASLVVLAESLGTGRILSTDRRDFGAYRWMRTKPFTNLMRHCRPLVTGHLSSIAGCSLDAPRGPQPAQPVRQDARRLRR